MIVAPLARVSAQNSVVSGTYFLELAKGFEPPTL
jgi:hypothetical protein